MEAAAIALRRDVRVMSLIGGVHGLTHFMQLVLPPLFPLIRDELGYSYTELGLLITVFFIFSGVFQTPAGFLVDRYGARPMLFGGLALIAGATTLYGVFTEYWALVALSAVAGLGNCVFHPVDFAILSASIEERRVGRAFGVHAFVAFVGYGAAPIGMVLLAQWLGWREAAMAVGLTAFAYLALMAVFARDFRDSDAVKRRAKPATPATPPKSAPPPGGAALLVTVPVIALFVFFVLLAMGQFGLQTFSQPALIEMYGTPLEVANAAVTALLAGTLLGTLIGGWLADRSSGHNLIAAVFMAAAGVIMIIAGLVEMGDAARYALYVAAGIVLGIVSPSRDMLVRRIAPEGSRGKVFGFVYSGLDTGSAVVPLIVGGLIDAGQAWGVFVTIGVCFVLCVPALMVSARATPPSAAASADAHGEAPRP